MIPYKPENLRIPKNLESRRPVCPNVAVGRDSLYTGKRGSDKSLDFGICGTQGRRAMIMMVEEREKVRRGRPPGGGEGGRPVRVPAEIAEQARVVGQLEGKTMGEVLVAFAAEALEAAYHAAMAARERYAARTVGRRPEARGAAPEPRRGASGLGPRGPYRGPGARDEDRADPRRLGDIRTGPNRPSRPRPDARPARSRRPWRKPGRRRPSRGERGRGLMGDNFMFVDEYQELHDKILAGDDAGALAILSDLDEMSRDDKINKIESFMRVLLVHLVKREAEGRTTGSWDKSIKVASLEIA